jgi:hypothetical protein
MADPRPTRSNADPAALVPLPWSRVRPWRQRRPAPSWANRVRRFSAFQALFALPAVVFGPRERAARQRAGAERAGGAHGVDPRGV